jgi:hypothetical protein
MLNWKDEFRRIIAKKFNEMTGLNIPLDSIRTVELELDLNFETLELNDLAHLYAFALMKEEFENAQKILDENYRKKL